MPCQRTILATKSKKQVPAQSDGQPPIDFECCETSTHDENQLPLQEVVLEDDKNLSQPHTSASQSERKKLIAALEAQLAATKDREAKLRVDIASTKQALATQAFQLS